VVAAAHAELPVTTPRRRWRAVAATGCAAAAAALGATAVAAPNSDVGHFVRNVLGIDEARPKPALVHIPGGGRLLVHAGDSAWVVAADGSRRRLGAFDGAAWSPHGLFVVAWRDHTLTALTPTGTPRWSVSRPGPVSAARWAPGDGFRIAYREGSMLRVVNGDGTGDHAYAAALPTVAPAWQPGADHVLAYVTAGGRIAVAAVDERRTLWHSRPLATAAFGLRWSADGRRLAVVTPTGVRIWAADGRLLRRIAVAGISSAIWAPRGNRLAVVQPGAGGASRLVLYGSAQGPRTLFTAPGALGTPSWSPDGTRILVPWSQAGQWLFLRVSGPVPAVDAVAGIARQFAPGAGRAAFPDAVSWISRP
jgi:hypothetical protein